MSWIVVKKTTEYGPRITYQGVSELCESEQDADREAQQLTASDVHPGTGLQELAHNVASRCYLACEVVDEDVDLNDVWDRVDQWTDLNDRVLPELWAEFEADHDEEAETYGDANAWVERNTDAVDQCIEAALGDKGLALVSEPDSTRAHIVRVHGVVAA